LKNDNQNEAKASKPKKTRGKKMTLTPETNWKLWKELRFEHVLPFNCMGDFKHTERGLKRLIGDDHEIDFESTMNWIRNIARCDCKLLEWHWKKFCTDPTTILNGK
jgi:hypothetical protein